MRSKCLHAALVVLSSLVVGTPAALGTKYIKDDATGGDATSIGNWDWATKTCTLTTDVAETIQIDSDGITLDGNGHTVSGSGVGGYGYNGVSLSGRTYVTVKDLTVQGFYYGIELDYSSNNTLTRNTVSNNQRYGISLVSYSDNNTLTDNTISNNRCGLRMYYCTDNQIYNNNFISNLSQAYAYVGSGNDFNLPEPIGGNYWSDHTGPDANGDGFVDDPYVFYYGGQDDLPWAEPDGWECRDPRDMIQELADQVLSLNLQHGISNSLDAKLAAAFQALEDIHESNDVAAIHTLEAFINAVEAQRGSKIPETDADALIAKAQR